MQREQSYTTTKDASMCTAESPRTVEVGVAMHVFMADLFPVCRSIMGPGIRETLARIRERVPIVIHEVPSGTRVFDWTIPREWHIRDAYVANLHGERVVDFRQSNLHVMSYSIPIRKRISRAELFAHLHTDPAHPDWIPYRTSYYREDWGFCVSQHQADRLADTEYDVVIDASLIDGALAYGEIVIPGRRDDEVLLSTYLCHPSMCNDNLSGVVLTTFLAEWLAGEPREYTYRILFIPETIGAITWLARNESMVSRIRHGLVVTCVGDPGPFTYKRSRRGDAEIDRAVEHVLATSGEAYTVEDFFPTGSDERQFCSPGFDLPVGSLMRTRYARYAQYHTSADDLSLCTPNALAGSLSMYERALEVLEYNRTYRSLYPKCEPQLGWRGLYDTVDRGRVEHTVFSIAVKWVLAFADGSHALLDIARRASLPFHAVRAAAAALHAAGLLTEINSNMRVPASDGA